MHRADVRYATTCVSVGERKVCLRVADGGNSSVVGGVHLASCGNRRIGAFCKRLRRLSSQGNAQFHVLVS